MSKNDRITVKQLSPGVLDMKFMLRTKKRLEAKDKKRKDLDLQKSFTEPKVEENEVASSSKDISKEAKLEICSDLTKLENLYFGRMSFKGYNKEVEDLMVYYEKLKNGELSDDEHDEEGNDVKDAEMADALSKKFLSKRFRKKNSTKNEETSSKGGKLNFSDVRKRSAPTGGDVEEPERKFLKPEY